MSDFSSDDSIKDPTYNPLEATSRSHLNSSVMLGFDDDVPLAESTPIRPTNVDDNNNDNENENNIRKRKATEEEAGPSKRQKLDTIHILSDSYFKSVQVVFSKLQKCWNNCKLIIIF